MKETDTISKLIKAAKEKIKDPTECNKLAEKALTLTDTIPDKKQKAEFLLEIGILFFEISNCNKSNKIITLALRVFERLQLKEKIVSCFNYIGLGLVELKKYEEAK